MTKQELKELIEKSDVPVSIRFDDLERIFGLKRVDGLEYALNKVFTPGYTEEKASRLPPRETHANIEIWCVDNNIYFEYNFKDNTYVFLTKPGAKWQK